MTAPGATTSRATTSGVTASSFPHELVDGRFLDALLKVMAATNVVGRDPEPAPAEGGSETGTHPKPETDWAAINSRCLELLAPTACRSPVCHEVARTAAQGAWLASELPSEVIAYLVRTTPPPLVWSYLSHFRQRRVMFTVTKGFQHTPAVLRNPAVRARLITWFTANPMENHCLLMAWGFSNPVPPVLAAVDRISEPTPTLDQLGQVIGRYGTDAVLAASAQLVRQDLFDSVLEVQADPDTLLELMQSTEPLAEGDKTSEPNNEPSDGAENPPVPSPLPEEWLDLKASHSLLQQRLSSAQAEQGRLSSELALGKAREKAAATQWEKKLMAAAARPRAELEELKRTHERSERKLRAWEREGLELQTENRRLKKQLRRSQQLFEEERRRATALEALLQAGSAGSAPVKAVSSPEVTPATPSRPVVVAPPTPLDEIFEWRADTRPVKITPRAVRRLIDANDEDAVFAIMQALESLEQSDWTLHRKFLNRLKEAGEYYPRVLTKALNRVLVDASNVARFSPNRYNKGQIKHLYAVREELRRRDCFPIVFYADASLPHFIDHPHDLRAMVARGEMIMSNAGQEADELLAREARRTGAYVVTNDRLFFNKVSPDFEPPRITFRIYDETVIVDDF